MPKKSYSFNNLTIASLPAFSNHSLSEVDTFLDLLKTDKIISSCDSSFFRFNLKSSGSILLDYTFILDILDKIFLKSDSHDATCATIRQSMRSNFRPSIQDLTSYLDDLVSDNVLKIHKVEKQKNYFTYN